MRKYIAALVAFVFPIARTAVLEIVAETAYNAANPKPMTRTRRSSYYYDPRARHKVYREPVIPRQREEDEKTLSREERDFHDVVFVKKGAQAEARELLRKHGLAD